jgi:hypothetical protein
MESNTLDSVTDRLNELILQRERFQARYDARAAGFLDCLPALFRLFHRLNFDLDVAPASRRRAASIAVYIAEAHDFCGESNLGVEGLIDDLWVAYVGLGQLAGSVPMETLQRHWLSPIPFASACVLARHTSQLEAHVPSRVLGLLKTFMEPDDPCASTR